MKKSLLIVTSFCIGLVSANAQITIATADMPNPTKAIYQGNDTLPTISVGTASGTSQTWNMTALAHHTNDTSIAMNYSLAPNAAFSTANIVVKQGATGFYGYFHNSATNFSLLGGAALINIQGTHVHINQINSPAETIFEFPCSYDSTFTNNFNTDAKFHLGATVQGILIDSIHRKSSTKKTVLVDAWGTLTTPMAGGAHNVLRIKETKINHDTTEAFFFGGWNGIPGGITADSVTTYSWWANGFSAPLAQATMDSAGAVKSVQWLRSIPTLPPLSASVHGTNVSCHGLCDGTAAVTAHWGTPPFTYSWNTNPVQTTDSVSGLCVGSHMVTVKDSIGDSAVVTVIIHLPPVPIITASGIVLSTSFVASSYQWFKNDTLITGATSSQYTVSSNGHYTVVTVDNGCHDTSVFYNFHTIGINEYLTNNNVNIYPNPAANQITVQFDATIAPSKQDAMIEIRNQLGQSVKKVGIKGNKNEMLIDLTDLPGGVYFIQIQNQNNSINKKFIKQ